MDIKEKIKEIMYDSGIDDEWCDVDSLKYIKFLAAIEEEFSIELPNIYLQSDFVMSAEGIVENIQKVIETELEKR